MWKRTIKNVLLLEPRDDEWRRGFLHRLILFLELREPSRSKERRGGIPCDMGMRESQGSSCEWVKEGARRKRVGESTRKEVVNIMLSRRKRR